MQVPKLKVLVEAGVVHEVEVLHDAAADGWTVRVSYASWHGERVEVLERQRGGARVFRHPGCRGARPDRAGADRVPDQRHRPDRGGTAMKRGLWLALLGWPALAAAWEEEPAIAFILAYNPVVVAPRHGRLPTARRLAPGDGTHLVLCPGRVGHVEHGLGRRRHHHGV